MMKLLDDMSFKSFKDCNFKLFPFGLKVQKDKKSIYIHGASIDDGLYFNDENKLYYNEDDFYKALRKKLN
ncbi:MAG: hypothetical protein GY756_01175 [bacterium]|nr:hypothetical protein [bacterium]